MIPILINSEFLIIMHSFPLGLDEIPQGLAIYGQLINLTSICKHRKKKTRKNDKWHPFEKRGKGRQYSMVSYWQHCPFCWRRIARTHCLSGKVSSFISWVTLPCLPGGFLLSMVLRSNTWGGHRRGVPLRDCKASGWCLFVWSLGLET